MTAIVVDASIAVAWFAEEVGTPAARRVQEADADLIAPSFLLAEIANALLMKSKRGLLPPGHANAALDDLRHSRAVELVGMATLIGPASRISERLSHPVYDCLYFALAQREQAVLATLDRRMIALADRLAIPLWDTAA